MSKKLSLLELIIMGVGQIIGAGIMVLLCLAIGITGKGVALSFALAAIIVIIPIIALAALGSAIPNDGGMYSYVRDLLGKSAGFFYVALLVAGQFVLAQYAIGFSNYAKILFPNVNIQILSALVMTFVFIINIMGLKTTMFIQKIVVYILVISLFSFAFFGIFKVTDFKSFTDISQIFPNGFAGFLSASVLVRYALIGGEFLSEFGGNAKNPGKNIPIAIIVSTIFVAILYIFIAIVASGILPLDVVAKNNLAIVAEKILPPYLYYFFIIGGGMFALLSSLNAVFAWATKGIKQAIKDGWLPKWLANENKLFNTPHYLLLIYYLIGMYPIIIGQEIKSISVIGANIGLLFSGFPVVAIMFLKKKRPNEYKNAKFKLPPFLMLIIPIISLIIYTIGIASSFSYLSKEKAIIPIISYCVIVFIYIILRKPYVDKIDKN